MPTQPLMVQNLAKQYGSAASTNKGFSNPAATPKAQAGGLIKGALNFMSKPFGQSAPPPLKPVSNGVQAQFPGLGGKLEAPTLPPTQVSGTSKAQTAPLAKASPQPQASYTPTTTTMNPNQGYYGMEQSQTPGFNLPQSVDYNAGNSYAQPAPTYINAQQTPQAGLIQSLLNLQSRIQPSVQNAAGQIRDLRTSLANSLYQNNTQPIPIEFQQGRAGQMINQEASREAAANGYLQNLLSGYNAAAAPLNTAISASAPLAGNALGYVTPTGQTIGDTQSQGFAGMTRYAQAQNNISQGNTFAQQAAPLAATLQQIDLLTPRLTQFMTENNLNSQTSPWVNQPIKTYMAQANPAAVQSMNAMFVELKTYIAQILGASGLNPTEVAADVNSFDPSLLHPSQLEPFITNVRNLGMNRLQPLQQASQQAYGANYTGGNPYLGAAADMSQPNANSTITPGYSSNPLVQFGAGAGIQAGSTVAGIGGLVGAAERLFGLGAK